jgi:protein-S-isoprenylcysteine O-methyltransferase Ste14
MSDMQDALILTAVVVYVAAAFIWPTLRVWRRHGIWPIVLSREAAPAQRLLGWLTGALFVVLVGASVGRLVVGADRLGVWSAPAALQPFGWLLLTSGALLTVVAQRQMGASWRVGIDDRPTGLVDSGVFQVVRNPIFTGLSIFLAGYACLTPAWWSLTLWVATAVGLRVQVGWEERHLVGHHGATYLAYAARVGRFVPWMGRLRSPAPGADSQGRS